MTERSSFIRAVLAVAAAAVIAGCSGEDVTGSHPDYPRTWISDDVIVVDTEPGLVFHDISEDEMLLIFLGGRKVRTGDLLVGSGRGGFIRRVRTVESDGKMLRVRTEPRFLTDAVVMGYDDISVTISPSSSTISMQAQADTESLHAELLHLPALSAAEDRTDAATASPALLSGSKISLDRISLYEGTGEDTSNVRIERGNISFFPRIDAGLAINGRLVTRLGIALRGEMEIDLDISADLLEEASHDGIVGVLTLSRTARMEIGDIPIPVVIELNILIDSKIEGITTEPCEATYEGSHSISAGIAFDGSWKETGSGTDLAFELPAMEIGPMSDCSIRIAVRTEVRVSFYSADVAVLGVDPWIDSDCTIESFPVWKWSLTGGVAVDRRFDPVMLGRSVPAFTAESLTESAGLDSGPYESDDYILVKMWGGPGAERFQLDQPAGIATADDGRVYVTDQNNHRVIVFDRLGEYLDEWGSYGNSEGMFLFPAGIAIASDGTVLVSDPGNHRIQRFTADGVFIDQWGSEGTGDGQFIQLEGIAAGPDSLVAACDSGTSSFSIYSLAGTFIGRFPSVLARGAAFDGQSNIYTAGCRSDGITKTDRDGQYLSTLGPDLCVTGLAVGPGGRIFVLDYDLDRLDILDPAGEVVSSIGSSGTGEGEFNRPGGVAISPEGWIYIADTANDRIQVFAPK
jgi:DNA-binding beta-propeller fold protein YncE